MGPEWRELCKAHGLLACHSQPVIAKSGKAVASLVMFFDRPRCPDEREAEIARFFANLASIAIEHERAAEALRENGGQLQRELDAARSLQEISTELIQENNTEALYRKLLDAAMTIMRSDFGSIQLYFPSRGELQLLAYEGFHPKSAEFWTWVRADSSSTCGKALETGGRVIARDVELCDYMAGTDDLHFYRKSKIRAVQSTPLVSRDGQIVGMISNHWHEPHQPRDREIRLLDVLARQAADLIDRTMAEERRKILVAELNHRVKNTLAVVQSIARQSFHEHHSWSEARSAFEGRLQALAGAHNLLTRQHWESADLSEIVASALEACGVSKRVKCDGPAVRLDPRSAVTLSIGVHELCTNAIKYGALSTPNGSVELWWRIEANGERRLHIHWEESGGPPVEPPKRRGFGTRVLERVLAADLAATVSLDYRTSGLVCEIDAPAPGAKPI